MYQDFLPGHRVPLAWLLHDSKRPESACGYLLGILLRSEAQGTVFSSERDNTQTSDIDCWTVCGSCLSAVSKHWNRFARMQNAFSTKRRALDNL
jgi:hypothetical protein